MRKAKVLKVSLEAGERLRHIGDKPEFEGADHFGVISVAAKANFDAKTVSIGLSFCSPTDCYYRQRGGRIALGRLRKHPIVLKFNENPAPAIQKFLMKVFADGSQLAREAYMLSSKAFRATVEAYLTEGFKCDMILEAPFKAMKHFPLMFPWWWDYKFPESWSAAPETAPKAAPETAPETAVA